VSNSQTLSDSPCCSLGKIFSLNCPCKKHISGAGIPLIPVAKIIEKNITWHISCYFLIVRWDIFNKSYWGGRHMPSRDPPCCGISWNAH